MIAKFKKRHGIMNCFIIIDLEENKTENDFLDHELSI